MESSALFGDCKHLFGLRSYGNPAYRIGLEVGPCNEVYVLVSELPRGVMFACMQRLRLFILLLVYPSMVWYACC